MALEHEALTERIIGAAIEVHKAHRLTIEIIDARPPKPVGCLQLKWPTEQGTTFNSSFLRTTPVAFFSWIPGFLSGFLRQPHADSMFQPTCGGSSKLPP